MVSWFQDPTKANEDKEAQPTKMEITEKDLAIAKLTAQVELLQAISGLKDSHAKELLQVKDQQIVDHKEAQQKQLELAKFALDLQANDLTPKPVYPVAFNQPRLAIQQPPQ